jgi:hypothetical protein
LSACWPSRATAPPRPGPIAPERATLSRDLGDFLIELSIALHKHPMYPEDHRSLGPAATAVTHRAALLLEDRATLSLGVARVRGSADDAAAPIPTATLGYSLSEEGDTLRWVHDEVRVRGLLPLTEAEAVVRSLYGARIILRSEEDLDVAAVVAYEHHVMLNGDGYPRFRFRRECHYASKLVHVCDVYDALRTNRPYREAWPLGKTLAHLTDRAGIEFDPGLVGAFVRMMAQWEPQVTVMTDEHTPVIPAVAPAVGS